VGRGHPQSYQLDDGGLGKVEREVHRDPTQAGSDDKAHKAAQHDEEDGRLEGSSLAETDARDNKSNRGCKHQ
jgi:hypothetical protein